jgi:hypothetical protein
VISTVLLNIAGAIASAPPPPPPLIVVFLLFAPAAAVSSSSEESSPAIHSQLSLKTYPSSKRSLKSSQVQLLASERVEMEEATTEGENYQKVSVRWRYL